MGISNNFKFKQRELNKLWRVLKLKDINSLLSDTYKFACYTSPLYHNEKLAIEVEEIKKIFWCDTFWERDIEDFWHTKYLQKIPSRITPRAFKLYKKIKEHTGLIMFPAINRAYYGHWQRSLGEVSWGSRATNEDREYIFEINSCDPVKYLLKLNVKIELMAPGTMVVEITGQRNLI